MHFELLTGPSPAGTVEHASTIHVNKVALTSVFIRAKQLSAAFFPLAFQTQKHYETHEQ
jgi:hypothetical protein